MSSSVFEPVGDIELLVVVGRGGGASRDFLDVACRRTFAATQRVLDHDLELQRAHLQLITRLHNTGPFDPLTVHVRAVLAAEIAENHLLVVHRDHAMAAADGIATRAKMTLLTPANQELRHGNDDFSASLRPLHHPQFD